MLVKDAHDANFVVADAVDDDVGADEIGKVNVDASEVSAPVDRDLVGLALLAPLGGRGPCRNTERANMSMMCEVASSASCASARVALLACVSQFARRHARSALFSGSRQRTLPNRRER